MVSVPDVRRPHRRTHQLMGTVASLSVHSAEPPSRIDTVVDAALRDLEEVEAAFSTYRPESQICRLNRGELAVEECDLMVGEVLRACAWLENRSDGAFDIHRGDGAGRDPSGFAKGWAIQRLSDSLVRQGLGDHLVGIGGDLMARGRRFDDTAWTVAISDPRDRNRVLTTIPLQDSGIATSGNAERGDHIWSDRYVQSPYLSVTVTGPTIMWADAFATAAFAMGSSGPGWVAEFNGYAAVTVDPDGTMVQTVGSR